MTDKNYEELMVEGYREMAEENLEIAKAAQEKLKNYYRDMTDEELKEKVAKTLANKRSPQWEVLNQECRQDWLDFADQILFLVTPCIVEKRNKEILEKIEGIENPHKYHRGLWHEELQGYLLCNETVEENAAHNGFNEGIQAVKEEVEK